MQSNADERINNLLNHLYLGALGREPSAPELSAGRVRLSGAAAQGDRQVVAAAMELGREVFTAAECEARSRSDAEYVTDLYAGLWQRAPDEAGLLSWTQTVVQEERGGVLTSFLTSGEFKTLAAALSVQVDWLVTDHLGTPRMVVDKTGRLAGIKRHDYFPFGEEVGAGVSGRTTNQGYGQPEGNRKKWAQLERDDETGLDYAQARYYSSAQGRFTSPDEFTGGPDELFDFVDDAAANPTFYADLTNPQSLNKYQYAYNNPLRYTDSVGHCPTGICVEEIVNPVTISIPGVRETALAIAGTVVLAHAIDAIPGSKTEGDGSCQACDNNNSRTAQNIFAKNEAEKKKTVVDPVSGNQVTPQKAENLAKADKQGMPRDQLGPSGRPKVNVVKHPTEKRAKDAARNEGQSKPAKDATPTKGEPHYHPTNPDGSRKKGKKNVHHEYPD